MSDSTDFWNKNSTKVTKLSTALSGGDNGDNYVFATCMELALRERSLASLKKLKALNLSPIEISQMFERHGNCFQDLIDEIKALKPKRSPKQRGKTRNA